MPWKEWSVMDERMQFVSRLLGSGQVIEGDLKRLAPQVGLEPTTHALKGLPERRLNNLRRFVTECDRVLPKPHWTRV